MTSPGPAPLPESSPGALAARVWRGYLGKRRGAVAAAAACAITAGALNGVVVGLLAKVVDTELSAHGGWGWLTLPLLIAALALARGGALVGVSLITNRVGNGVV